MKPRQAMIDNIFEARLQLETIEELLLDPEYTEGEFRSAMEHRLPPYQLCMEHSQCVGCRSSGVFP